MKAFEIVSSIKLGERFNRGSNDNLYIRTYPWSNHRKQTFQVIELLTGNCTKMLAVYDDIQNETELAIGKAHIIGKIRQFFEDKQKMVYEIRYANETQLQNGTYDSRFTEDLKSAEQTFDTLVSGAKLLHETLYISLWWGDFLSMTTFVNPKDLMGKHIKVLEGKKEQNSKGGVN